MATASSIPNAGIRILVHSPSSQILELAWYLQANYTVAICIFKHEFIKIKITLKLLKLHQNLDIVFQPTAWASAASTKTFWWSVDRLKGVGKK